MSKIKEIYVDGSLRSDYKSVALYIEGQEIKTNTKFNIFNRRVLDLNQNSDFTIIYTLQVLKDEKRDQQNSTDGTTSESAVQLTAQPNNELTSNNTEQERVRTDADARIAIQTGELTTGLPIKEPTKNRSSITINGTSASDSQTFVRINGKLVTDSSRIDLYLDGRKVKNANLTIILELKKDDILKYVRLKKK